MKTCHFSWKMELVISCARCVISYDCLMARGKGLSSSVWYDCEFLMVALLNMCTDGSKNGG